MGDLNIEIGLEKDKAIVEAGKVVQDFRRINQRLLSDAEIASEAERAIYQQTNEEKIRGAVQAANRETAIEQARFDSIKSFREAALEDERRHNQQTTAAAKASADQIKAAYGQHAKAGQQSFGAVAVAVGGVAMAARAAYQVVVDLGAEFNRVGQKALALSAEFSGNRDDLRGLAALRGQQSTDEFTVGILREARDAAMTLPEMRQFQESFYNAGAQFEGKTIDREQFGQFRLEAAAYGTALKITPDDMGKLAGVSLGFKDLSKLPKDKQAAAALGDLTSSIAVLQRGQGETPVLAGQMAKLGASSLNEDEMMGTFSNQTDMATAISIAAESSPSTADEQIRAANRGLRDFKGKKSADILKEAGITPKTPFLESVRRLAPVVQKKAKEQGVKVEDVLRENFEDIQTATAIGVQINKGVIGGGYDDRQAVARANAGPEPARTVIRDFQALPVGQNRIADADNKLADAEVAAKNSTLSILRKQAGARLRRDGRIDTNEAAISAYASGKLTAGMMGDAEQKTIDDEVQRMLQARAGTLVEPEPGNWFNVTPQQRGDELNRFIGRMRERKIDPLQDNGAKVDTTAGMFLREDSPLGQLFNGGRDPQENARDGLFGVFNPFGMFGKAAYQPQAFGAPAQTPTSVPGGTATPDAGAQAIVRKLDEQTALMRQEADARQQGAPRPLMPPPVVQRR